MDKQLEKLKADFAWLEDMFFEYVDEMKDTILSLNRTIKDMEKKLKEKGEI